MTYDPRGWVRALVRAVLTDAQLERLGRAAVARVESEKQKAAAPGESGAAATAAPVKGDTAVSHDITHEHTTQGRQMAAALALAHLLEQDLPAATWTLYTATPDELDGQIDRHTVGADDEPSIRAAIGEWAEFLRGEITTRRYQGQPGIGSISVTGTYRGVRVKVWAQVSLPTRALNGGAS